MKLFTIFVLIVLGYNYAFGQNHEFEDICYFTDTAGRLYNNELVRINLNINDKYITQIEFGTRNELYLVYRNPPPQGSPSNGVDILLEYDDVLTSGTTLNNPRVIEQTGHDITSVEFIDPTFHMLTADDRIILGSALREGESFGHYYMSPEPGEAVLDVAWIRETGLALVTYGNGNMYWYVPMVAPGTPNFQRNADYYPVDYLERDYYDLASYGSAIFGLSGDGLYLLEFDNDYPPELLKETLITNHTFEGITSPPVESLDGNTENIVYAWNPNEVHKINLIIEEPTNSYHWTNYPLFNETIPIDIEKITCASRNTERDVTIPYILGNRVELHTVCNCSAEAIDTSFEPSNFITPVPQDQQDVNPTLMIVREYVTGDGRGNTIQVERWWQTLDNSSNPAYLIQHIVVHVLGQTTLVGPTMITGECNNINMIEPIVLTEIGCTNCVITPGDDVGLTYEDVNGARIWSAIDRCDNTITLEQRLNITGDNEPPVLELLLPGNTPSDHTPPECPTVPTVRATDNCDGTSVHIPTWIESTICGTTWGWDICDQSSNCAQLEYELTFPSNLQNK